MILIEYLRWMVTCTPFTTWEQWTTRLETSSRRWTITSTTSFDSPEMDRTPPYRSTTYPCKLSTPRVDQIYYYYYYYYYYLLLLLSRGRLHHYNFPLLQKLGKFSFETEGFRSAFVGGKGSIKAIGLKA